MQDTWRVAGGSPHGYVFSDLLADVSWVRHGVTTRHGNLNLSFTTEPDAERVRASRAAACGLFGRGLDDLTIGEQVHGGAVAVVGPDERGRGGRDRADAIAGVDALATDTPGLLLAVTIADCLPVVLVDPAHRAVAVVHSGWRGTAAGITAAMLGAMGDRFCTDPADVLAAIGPGIAGDCYEVGPEVRDAMLAAGAGAEAFRPSPAGRWLMDLRTVVVGQLLGAGVGRDRVSVAPWCTHCERNLLFSHRGEGPGAGRMGAFVTIEGP